MNSYTTTQGDTWDMIAYRLWGSEYLYPVLLEANYKYRHIVFFDADIKLNVPESVDTSIYNERPPWLENVDEDDTTDNNDDGSESG